MPEAIIFSDAHVTSDNPAGAARLTDFLRRVCPSAKRVFILGDLFEFWVGPSQARYEPYRSVLECIRALSRAGVKVTFYHGNRDFYITRLEAARFGFRLVRGHSVETVCGKRLLLCHGDMLCTNDRAYHMMKLFLRNPVFQFMLAITPVPVAEKVARLGRATSATAVAAKSQRVLGIDAGAVRKCLALGVDAIISGHTHRAGKADFETADGTRTLYTIGDFGTDGAYLECGTDGIVARKLGDSMPEGR